MRLLLVTTTRPAVLQLLAHVVQQFSGARLLRISVITTDGNLFYPQMEGCHDSVIWNMVHTNHKSVPWTLELGGPRLNTDHILHSCYNIARMA